MTNKKSDIVFKGLSFSWGEHVVNIIIPIITMPIAYRFFGAEAYGIWLVVMSFVAFLQFSDFGINIASQNKISQNNELSKQAEVIKKSFIILLVIGLVIIIISFGIYYFIDNWVLWLGKIPSEYKGKAELITLIMVIYFAISLPLKLSLSIFTALQKIHVASIYRIISRLVQAFSLLLVVFSGGDLIQYSLLICFGQIALSLTSYFHLCFSNMKLFKTIIGSASSTIRYRELIGNGFRFLNLSISTMVILNAGNIIISHAMGPPMVPLFAVTFRLFFMGIQLANSIGVVLWPMYAMAVGESNWGWISRTYKVSMIIHTRFGAALWLGGVLFSESIIRIWVGEELYPGSKFIYLIGAWSFFTSFAGGAISLLNAIGPTIAQVLIQWVYTLLYLITSLALINSIGITGVAIGLIGGVVVAYGLVPKHYVHMRTKGKIQIDLNNIILHLVFVVLPSLVVSWVIQTHSPHNYRFLYSISIFAIFAVASIVTVPSGVKIKIINMVLKKSIL